MGWVSVVIVRTCDIIFTMFFHIWAWGSGWSCVIDCNYLFLAHLQHILIVWSFQPIGNHEKYLTSQDNDRSFFPLYKFRRFGITRYREAAQTIKIYEGGPWKLYLKKWRFITFSQVYKDIRTHYARSWNKEGWSKCIIEKLCWVFRRALS